MRRLATAFVLICILVPGGIAASLWSLAHRDGPLRTGTDHVVSRGGVSSIARSLGEAGILPRGRMARLGFRIVTRLTASEGPLHAAELHFPAHVSMLGTLAILRHAAPVRHQLTIPEGLTSRQIAALIAHTPYLSGPVPEFAEGSVFPQTIDYERGVSRVQIVHRLQTLMRRSLDTLWAARDPGLGLANAEEMLTLASIVERETAAPQERPLIARVFLNRLARGMKLQSDPTAIYDLSAGLGVLDHPLTHEELHRPGPHNTYAISGLPAGPICSPGRAALEAVAHPAPGDMLYFVADGRGGHGFSSTLDAHNRKVGALRALRRGNRPSGPEPKERP
ncbi:endolytic transglycosylase MltG [Swaminathania salitolerans]|uniref:Endolytic murein transglycosylase n=1 Tax=Swaminathania salitolerans TaxID=182838 RepID=A0A511BRY4_9PROT|nr:endolytic transglycosylase MltG [Swaminathania salitolerans]GBQ12572.1 aminodeoxychorismate lyase [Swaminathania salitolerans LMG 21291]GEL03097.1 hypothetical protein SSA02_22600 [Swaminathania salitolerans]